MIWSLLAEIKTSSIITTDFLYLRFLGDRSIHEKDFGRIQIDTVLEMQKCADNIKNIQDQSVNLAIIEQIITTPVLTWYGEYISKYDGITRCKVATKEEGVQEQQKQHQEQDHDMKQITLSDFL